MVERLQDLHKSWIIHEDIKPHNTVIGLGDQSGMIHLIDFGLSQYLMDKDREHIKMRQLNHFNGTARYASSNAHKYL